MDNTHVTNLTEGTDAAARQEPENALRAFAQLLARLVADRSVIDAMGPDAGTDETVPAAASHATTVE